MNNKIIQNCEATGITIEEKNGKVFWSGKYGGCIKPKGPLNGKRIGVLAAAEFSDFQAYYLVSYIGEMGGICEFLLIDWVKYKNVRPNIPEKGVRGMWDLSLEPVPVMGGDKPIHYKNLKDAEPSDYDGVIVMGGHSGDIMVTETEVHDFLKAVNKMGSMISAIAGGIMPLISAGIMHSKRCTGDRSVDYMLKKIADFVTEPVITDGNLITASATINTPDFLRAVCRYFDPDYKDIWKGSLKSKKVMTLIGEDYEDMELIVAVMELLYRGAEVIIGMFRPEMRARPAMLDSDIATGSFGTTVPFQEIPDSYYRIIKLEDLKMNDFDLCCITGAFNPWNIVMTDTVDWLKEAYAAGKLLAGICHGAMPLAAADLVNGRELTGWTSSKDSVEIMGGIFNEECAAIIDGPIISGRTPPEMPEFIDAMSLALLS